MKIAVIGSTGLIGSQLVVALRDLKLEVVAASPSTGVDSLTGDGLDEALENVDVVFDVTNASSFGDKNAFDFFRRSGAKLTAAAAASGVGHYIVLSVVGTERLVENDYFRAKLVQENLVRASGLPFTILRSTQFFENCSGIVSMAADGNLIRLPHAFVQPVAAENTVQALKEVAFAEPDGTTVEVAGPELFHLDELASILITANQDPRAVLTDNTARYFDVQLGQRTLLPDTYAKAGETRFGDWLYRAMSN